MTGTLKLSVVDQSPVPSGATPADALRNTIDLARRVEALGYERFWIAEHHGTGAFASSAPEIVISAVAAATSTLRVGSGGVMLPHYSPYKVAEVFRTLHALYPDRIDLGLGRAPGGTPLETVALRRDRRKGLAEDDFPEQLDELSAWLGLARFEGEHPFGRVLASPKMPGGPALWLLGSSMWSSSTAAQQGLPYAFAHFIDPKPTRQAVENYRYNFEAIHGRPGRAVVAAGAIAAETEAEAWRLAQSVRLFRRRLTEGKWLGEIPSPEEADREIGPPTGRASFEAGEWPRVIVGTGAQVAGQLRGMAAALGVDEVMVLSIVHDHEARVRSYELIAREIGIGEAAHESVA